MRCVLARVVFLCLFCLSSAAHAATIYDSKGFEAPPFVAGQVLEGQDTADGPWVKTTSTSTATVINNPSGAQAGQQFVQVSRAANSDGRWAVSKPQSNVAGSLVIEWDMFVPQATGSQSFGPYYAVEAYDAVGNAPLLIGSAGMDAKTGEFLFQRSGTGVIDVTGLVLPFNTWHHFEMTLDYDAQEYSVSVNGTPAVTEGFVDAGITDFSDAPIAALGAAGDPDSQAATGTARFDNYLIRTEPSSFVVTKIADTNDGACNADCSLREAITAANDSADESVITFAQSANGVIDLTGTLPDFTSNIDLQGSGINLTAVRRNTGGNYRIFAISSGTTSSISGLTIVNGNINGVGGGVLNDHGTLTLSRCSLIGNISDNGGGAIFNNGSVGQPATTTVIECIFTDNSASFNGGAIYNDAFNGRANLIVRGCTFKNNITGGNGGAIYSTGAGGTATTQIENSTFDTSGANNGGAFFNEGSGGLATATVQSCTFNNNNANFGGSAIWSSGPAASTVTIGNNIFRVGTAGITLADSGNGCLVSQGFNIASDGANDDPQTPANETYLTGPGDRINTDPLLGPLQDNGGPTQTHALLQGSPAINAGNSSLATDQRGVARPQGSADDIGAFELFNSAQGGPNFVVTNLSDAGDGVCSTADCSLRQAVAAANSNVNVSVISFRSGLTGTIQLTSHLTISTAININGPASQRITVRGNGVAGFVLFAVNAGQSAQISNLTFSNGNAGFDNNGTLSLSRCTLRDNGGGVFNEQTATLTNCTLSGNGNGVFNTGTVNLEHCTLSSNSTGISNNAGIVNLRNSIVVANTTNISGNLSVDTNNLKNMTAAQAGLDPAGLAANGGPTLTIALLPGSPAINQGNSSLTTDQRGVTRPQGRASDIGSYEAILITISDQTITEGNSGTSNMNFAITLSAASPVPVSFNYATVSSSAKSGADFTSTLSDSDGTTPGILTIAAGQTTARITVPIVGDAINEANEVFYVLLSNASNAVFSKGRGTGTITDNDNTLPELSVSDVTIHEGNTGTPRNANFTLSLNAPSGQVVSVNVATTDGTARAGSDYFAMQTTNIRFSPGQTQRTVTVAVRGDTRDEDNETFFVNLVSPVNATLADNIGVGTIANDDRPPHLIISDMTTQEGNDGTKMLNFTVRMTAFSGKVVTVRYATANGIARAGSDYTSTSGTLSFAPFQTDGTETISIPISGDTQVEGDETFYVLLSDASNAFIGRGRALGTITNDDVSG
jgi:CSLREA domain-containing protein